MFCTAARSGKLDGVNSSVATRFRIVIPLALALIAFGCKTVALTKEPPPSCPQGTQIMGAPPPAGDEISCRKTVNGESIKEGPYVIYREDGSRILQGSFHDGKQDGDWTMWYENGQVKSIDHYKDGVQEGEHKSWYTNGKIDAIGQYKDGKRDGVWKRWDPQGFRNWTETYQDDKRIS